MVGAGLSDGARVVGATAAHALRFECHARQARVEPRQQRRQRRGHRVGELAKLSLVGIAALGGLVRRTGSAGTTVTIAVPLRVAT